MTVVLIALLNFESFAIRQLHAFLEREGIDVRSVFLKAAGNEFPTERELGILMSYLNSVKPSVVGINLPSRYFPLGKRITKMIKERFNSLVVWGGIHPTIVPAKCLEYADIVCRGEGEYALKELIKKIENKKDYTHIPNLWVKKNGKIIENPIRPLIQDLDSLPFTDFSNKNKVYIEQNKLATSPRQIKNNRMECYYCYPIMTSRGCLFGCTYCANSFLREMYKGKGNYTRRRSVKSVIEELKLAKKNFKYLNAITFGDDVFTFDYEWLKLFADEYKKHINLPFFTMFHPAMVDERCVKLLKDIGLVNIQMGIQSGSERIRKDYYNRIYSDEKLKDSMNTLKKYKATISCDLILGDVFEEQEDRDRTVDLLLSLPRPYILHCFNMNYFPNYQLTNKALKEGLITESQVVDNLPYHKQSFGVEFDKNRSNSVLFWESVYKLASLKYFPKKFTKKISKMKYLQENPKLLVSFTKTLIRLRHVSRVGKYLKDHVSDPKAVYSKINQKLAKKQIAS